MFYLKCFLIVATALTDLTLTACQQKDALFFVQTPITSLAVLCFHNAYAIFVTCAYFHLRRSHIQASGLRAFEFLVKMLFVGIIDF